MPSSQTSPKKPIIAVVGLSNRPDRPSYHVAAYMQAHGYRIVAVNPVYAGQSILGEYCYASLTEAAKALAANGEQMDVVDCFRQATEIAPIVDEAIAIQAKYIWMQLGIVNEAAATKARAAGLDVVMDKCMKIEHAMGNMHGVL